MVTDTIFSQQTAGDQPHEGIFLEAGLFHEIAMSPTTEVEGQHRSAIMTWTDVNFSKFAFDLLALLNGSYRHGHISSYYGFDFSELNRKISPIV
jgi:hypothetical protein